MVVFLLAALLGMVLFTKPEVIGQTAVVMYQYSMTVTAVDRFSLILSVYVSRESVDLRR